MNIALTLTQHDKTCSINNKYVDYVIDSGYQPFLFRQGTDVETIVGSTDGLILKGGVDVEPMHYYMENASSYDPDPDLDEFERQLLWAFVRANKPVFGICRGFQLIYLELLLNMRGGNEIGGLAFRQHIKDHSQNSNNVKRHIPFHFIDFFPKLYDWNMDAWGKESIRFIGVNSLHHQGVEKMKAFDKNYDPEESPIQVLAWSGKVIEAFCLKEHNVMAVQWHPEEMGDTNLLRGFFDGVEFDAQVAWEREMEEDDDI